MHASWTLNVENFGKIEKASIRISPMMLFVGENNSGKSYLMSLLWGLLTLSHDELMHSNSSTQLESFKKCEEWLSGIGQETYSSLILEPAIQQLFIDWYNDFLDANKNSLIARIFNHPISCDRLSVSDFKSKLPVRIDFLTESKSTFAYIPEQDRKRILMLPSPRPENRIRILKYITLKLVLGNLGFSAQSSLYFPASRTGFMLTYKMLLKSVIEHSFDSMDDSSRRSQAKLTLPVTHFLRDLAGLEFHPKETEYQSVARFLETEVVQGELVKDSSPVPSYAFKPSDLEEELSFHVTSSLVAELSPIILFLKSTYRFNFMIIEEPEAHLHLEMQRKMAIALSRLVNQGLPVWITTHSDTFFQQVNNLIKLHNHPNREQLAARYGYEPADSLDPNDVVAYQFTVVDGKTRIEPLELTEYGFVVPTFNKAIIDLSRETMALQEMDDDAE